MKIPLWCEGIAYKIEQRKIIRSIEIIKRELELWGCNFENINRQDILDAIAVIGGVADRCNRKGTLWKKKVWER